MLRAVDRHTPVESLPEFMTVAEVATWLTLAESTVYQAVSTGRLRAAKLGRAIRVRRDDLMAFVEKPRAVRS